MRARFVENHSNVDKSPRDVRRQNVPESTRIDVHGL